MNKATTTPKTEVKAEFIAVQVARGYFPQQVNKGKTNEEISKSFTKELMCELAKDFCDKYNFQMVGEL